MTFLRKNLLMANQPLTYLATKATEFGEITQNKAITPFKVIQGHGFWYQSKAHMRLVIRPITNLPTILHRFQVMADYWSNFR